MRWLIMVETQGQGPATVEFPTMVNVFPAPVWPYANTVPARTREVCIKMRGITDLKGAPTNRYVLLEQIEQYLQPLSET